MSLFLLYMKDKFLNQLRNFLIFIISKCSNLLGEIDQYTYFDKLELKESDIYIVTFLKSGTTWMQMILYQMLTDGKMDFDHIYDVSPWISNEAIKGKDPSRINELPEPRIYKSHDPYSKFDPQLKNKIIFVYRDGMDTALSLFHHQKNYNNSKQTFEDTFNNFFMSKEEYNWFTFTKTWLENTNNFNIHYVKYEDLKEKFDESLALIAKFLEVELNEEQIIRIKERSSFAYMKEHESKFGEQPLDKRVYNQFIREGQTGKGGDVFNENQKEIFQTQFNQYIKKYINKLG